MTLPTPPYRRTDIQQTPTITERIHGLEKHRNWILKQIADIAAHIKRLETRLYHLRASSPPYFDEEICAG